MIEKMKERKKIMKNTKIDRARLNKRKNGMNTNKQRRKG